MVDYYNRLFFLTFNFKKVEIASKLGISKQRLNYYFRTHHIPKTFLTKQIKRKITYYFRKNTTYAKANGLRKVYKFFKYNHTTMFTKIKLFGLSLAPAEKVLIQAKFKFVRTDNGSLYFPMTKVYNMVKGGFELFKKEVIQIHSMYNIVDPTEIFINGSTSVYFNNKILVIFMY